MSLPWLLKVSDKVRLSVSDSFVRIQIRDLAVGAPWTLSRTYDGTTWYTVPGADRLSGPDETVVDREARRGREFQYRLIRCDGGAEILGSESLFLADDEMEDA